MKRLQIEASLPEADHSLNEQQPQSSTGLIISSSSSDPLQKKIKLQTIVENHQDDALSQSRENPTRICSSSLAKLSFDEIELILEYLLIGELLMMSLCSKWWYQSVCGLVKEKFCKYYIHDDDDDWVLTKALRSAKSLSISYANIDQVRTVVDEIVEHGDSLNNFSKRLVFDSIDPTDIYEILSARIVKQESATTTIVKTAVLGAVADLEKRSLTDGESDESHDQVAFKQVEIKEIPIGFGLKELSLNDISLSRIDLYRILSKCCALEKLDLDGLQLAYYQPFASGKGRGGKGLRRGKSTKIEEDNDEFFNGHEGQVYVPVFGSLKSLTSNAIFDYNAGEKFMVDILKLCPNLEELHYIYQSPVDDSFLRHLSKMCPKLKKFVSEGYDGATPIEIEVTDEGLYELMKALPQLEHIHLNPCCNMSGEIFKKLGEFSQLKHFHVNRTSYNNGLVDMTSDIHFGGGVLSKLEYIDVGGCYDFETLEEFEKFITSLRSVAPHLKNFGELMFCESRRDSSGSIIDKKKLVELFSETIAHLDVDRAATDLASILPKNLTSLSMELTQEFVNKNVVTQLQPNYGLKKLTLHLYNDKPEMGSVIETLAVKIYPCVTHLRLYNICFGDNYDVLEKILSNPNAWPNLRFMDGVSNVKEILTIRPNIRLNLEDATDILNENCCSDDERSAFYYKWLIADQPFDSW
ncbi:hypothetical protein C9374_012099 [Naegleria lovaniensis]|uniref:F-box domain-containing protein n=1 Tax=Naegleria lovaniensis TaxID=51637 RepID=A0AA88KI39_NAELO|nr:uncharacterized protein C9374_012099 [Naegleria lovaniensis]KAG2373492.1 hypothetical protein C9374_012099 [Naegleria lovaniensis]